MVSGSLTTMKCQGCVLLELGAQRAACKILWMIASGTGSGLKSRTVRRVLMQLKTSMLNPPGNCRTINQALSKSAATLVGFRMVPTSSANAAGM